jgi:hypothetical protein
MCILVAALLLITPVLAQIPTARQEVLAEMEARPGDPWPRGIGHVLLAVPGSIEKQKAYHEPGGSFSPEVGSFGVSIWITDPSGAILQTSDSVPLAEIKENFVWQPGRVTPAIRTETADYHAEWSIQPDGNSRLVVRSPRKLTIAIRSVGPAGGPLESLTWSAQQLQVNGRYSIRVTPPPASVYVGPEGPAGWTTARSSSECHGHNGWCYARLELAGDAVAAISDRFPRARPTLSAHGTRSALEMYLPDQRFKDALDAQVAHLMMSLVSGQTHPGEPTNYPLTWLRDGSFQVVSLARAGRMETARELVRYFAENDFFGGFGAEGDAPGLSLWAVAEVAARAHERNFDLYLWPHVLRKALFIIGMMTTKEPVERVSLGPLVPNARQRQEIYEVARPAQDGLIYGRMDHGIRPLYITAVSYRGLVLASEFAERVGQKENAARWREAAASLREAWLRRFTAADKDERTFMCGLFPSWIAAPRKSDYKAGLEAHWKKIWNPDTEKLRDISYDGPPLWPYFNFAHAQNWLYAGEAGPAWKTLEYFWKNQPSPGLYSWWEGRGEENAFRQWEYVRGWVKPPYVTPHYWAAATHLLLQMDMLALVDESDAEPAIVIGAGIPAEWCSKPMKVHGAWTKAGLIDWDWDGRKMSVKVRGNRCPVRLGPGFPTGAGLEVGQH